jgi:FkbM family methyltransferase
LTQASSSELYRDEGLDLSASQRDVEIPFLEDGSTGVPIWVTLASKLIPHLPAGRYRIMNWVCRRSTSAFFMPMPAKLGGAFFVCDLRDTISREVCFAGFYEPQETSLLCSLLSQGMTFVDVGANWGYFSLLAARLVGNEGSVLAIEPDPRIFAKLEANIRRNRLTNVVPRQLAVSDRLCTMTLAGYNEAGENFGISRITEADDPTGNSFDVEACPLDALLDSLGVDCVDLVKIDVEGSEDLVVAGMKTGLERHRYRRLVLELHPSLLVERSKATRDVFQWLTQAGYRGWSINHSAAATRRAAYHRNERITDYLQPLIDGSQLDAWPHFLWLSPELDLDVSSPPGT